MKISCGFLLLLLGSALSAPAPKEAKLQNENVLYPYGMAEGDVKTPREDDGTSPGIHIKIPFVFYGKTYVIIYVNNNGVISFGGPVPSYTPEGIPLTDGKHFVAPYWGDVNNILGGDIWYREEERPEILRKLTQELNEYFPDNPFTATWAFVATWDDVAYFGSISKKVNTFQAILISDGQVSFIMLNYGKIQWTTGAASGGDRRTGLGGIPAQAGFNSGDDKNYFSIPGSRTPQIINITQTSNVGKLGRWVFRADHFKGTKIALVTLPPAKEEEKANDKEEQGQQSSGPNEAEVATTRNPPEEEESQVAQGNEVQGQEQNGETEPAPSVNVHEEEESQASQGSEVGPEAEGQEKEETESVPSGNLHEGESQANQNNEVISEPEGQEKEETESVPSGNVDEKEESQVKQDNEVISEPEGQEKEGTEPVPSGNVDEKEESQINQDNEVNSEAKEQEEPVPSGNTDGKEESQVNQGYENPKEEGQQQQEENGDVSAVGLPDSPAQKPQLDSDEQEDSEECEW